MQDGFGPGAPCPGPFIRPLNTGGSPIIRKTSVAVLIGLAALAAHGSASAESIPQDAINLSNAKLSLPEAVALAEKHHPGSKANQAELKFKKERLYYEVEVVTPKNEVFDVKVDAKDGTVFQSKPDNHD